MSRFMWVTLAFMMGLAPAQTQRAGGGESPPDPTREMTAAGIPGVIAAGTKTQFLRKDFNGTEGVLSMADGSVIFCEQNADRVIRIDHEGRFSTYLENTNRTIGLAYDPKGRLISVQSREPRVAVLAPTRTTLADSFEGQPLVRPNDLVIDSKGGIYFTDPIPRAEVAFREPPAGRRPLLFYITPKGELAQLTDEIAQPNGLQLSPDEKTLYAVDGDHITAFDVEQDGRVTRARAFADVRGDGLAVDSRGRLYAATDEGIRVISPTGEVLGLIPAPVRIQSIALAGRDRKMLFAVGSGAVYRISLLAEGLTERAK